MYCQDLREAGLQVQPLPASLSRPSAEETSAGLRRDGSRVKRVWAGLCWLNRLPQVLWECTLKLLCCNIDSGNLDGPTEFQLLICAPVGSDLVLPRLSLSAGT